MCTKRTSTAPIDRVLFNKAINNRLVTLIVLQTIDRALFIDAIYCRLTVSIVLQ